MKIIKLGLLSIVILPLYSRYTLDFTKPQYDVTVVGPMLYADGLGRASIAFMELFHEELKINYIPTKEIIFKDVPWVVKNIAQNPDKTPGKVSILFDVLWHVTGVPSDYVPASDIKIAYSMIESTAIPIQWVKILNEKFDAVAVPDKFLCDVYQKSGVKIPIFVLPCGIYLDEFLETPVKEKANWPFTFGMSAGFHSTHKNHELLIDAFAQEFGNNRNVRLKVHGRCGNPDIEKRALDKVRGYNYSNIEFINKSFTRNEYADFMSSLDCYVLLSKGEGFSITPREALAMGIPCIITNNSAHRTICETGFVKSVNAPIGALARYIHFKAYCGYNYSCTIEEARKALRKVHDNYSNYLEKARKGKEWVKQYSYKSLKNRYLNLVKPKKVMLGNCNSIEEDCVITNSKELYRKYLGVINTNIIN